MSDKSPRQGMSKKSGKSIKEKRAEKHAKAAGIVRNGRDHRGHIGPGALRSAQGGQHRLQPAQIAVGPPVLGELDGGAHQLVRILLELGLERIQDRFRIRDCCLPARVHLLKEHLISLKVAQ